MRFGLIDYSYIDKAQKGDHRCRCIDGKITGRSNCVGYCKVDDNHSGFLTARHCSDHHCLEKGCHYFLPKVKQVRVISRSSNLQPEIVAIASRTIFAFECMKIMRAEKANDRDWQVKYITISDAYPIREITQNISEAIGEAVVMINLNYDFDLAAQLIFGELVHSQLQKISFT